MGASCDIILWLKSYHGSVSLWVSGGVRVQTLLLTIKKRENDVSGIKTVPLLSNSSHAGSLSLGTDTLPHFPTHASACWKRAEGGARTSAHRARGGRTAGWGSCVVHAPKLGYSSREQDGAERSRAAAAELLLQRCFTTTARLILRRARRERPRLKKHAPIYV